MSTTLNPSSDIAAVPSSEVTRTRLQIVDHADTADEAGIYLTAYRQTGNDWLVTVDYFEDQSAWQVYVRMGDETTPVTPSIMADILAAHEDAQGIADHLNSHDITTRLINAATVRRQLAELTVGRVVEVTI
jgi:hypothetical protein